MSEVSYRYCDICGNSAIASLVIPNPPDRGGSVSYDACNAHLEQLHGMFGMRDKLKVELTEESRKLVSQ